AAPSRGRRVVTGRRATRLLPCLLAVGLAAACPAATPAQADAPLRVSRDVPGDARQLVMSADEVTTWEDGGQRVLLLNGQVLIDQSVLRARCQQAVARVDLERFRRSRVYHVDVYAAG